MSNVRLLCDSDVRAIPDGTIITWYRIPGDDTSEAVAFVRHQIETQEDADGRQIHVGQVTWISPGGWDPMTIEAAGITYPAKVLRWGDSIDPVPNLLTNPLFDADVIREASADGSSVEEIPSDQTSWIEGLETIKGGTWAREKALECASLLYQVKPPADKYRVLSVADAFVAWLERDVDAPEPPRADDDPAIELVPAMTEVEAKIALHRDLTELGVDHAAAVALGLSRRGWQK